MVAGLDLCLGRLQYLGILHLLDWSCGSRLSYLVPGHEQVFVRYLWVVVACVQSCSYGLVGSTTHALGGKADTLAASGMVYKAGLAANASTS
jgi:hypothetical protein